MNRKYELTLLARTDISDEDVKIALQNLKDLIVSSNGNILYAEYWGMRQLEYKINKNESATFYMIQYEASREINDLVEEKLRNSEIFMRYLIVLADEESIKVRTFNCLTDSNQTEDGVVFDKRYFNLVSSVFNIK